MTEAMSNTPGPTTVLVETAVRSDCLMRREQ